MQRTRRLREDDQQAREKKKTARAHRKRSRS
jgi:hypothetical protein